MVGGADLRAKGVTKSSRVSSSPSPFSARAALTDLHGRSKKSTLALLGIHVMADIVT